MTIQALRAGVLLTMGLSVIGLLRPAAAVAAEAGNLLTDGSFEEPIQRNQFGHVFKHWGGWKYEGDCEFRVGDVAHSGQHSALLFGASALKSASPSSSKTSSRAAIRSPPGSADSISAKACGT